MERRMDLQESHYTVQVTNIVAKTKCRPFLLTDISELPGCRYNPARFSAAFIRLSHGSCNIFSTGTVTFLGYKTETGLVNGAAEVRQRLGAKFVPLTENLEICNIAASFRLHTERLDLVDACTKLRGIEGAKVDYEPELSNGLLLSFEGALRIILHGSGKGIAVGAKRMIEINCAIDLIARFLIVK